MRAVRYSSVGGPLELVDVPEPACPADGAVVRVEATGICRSDWHAWRGHDPVPLPMIPGHEFAGTVATVGPDVVGFAVADFNLVRLPDAVDAVTAASLGCRFATSFHALTRQSHLSAGDWLAVYGCGGVGASAILIGKALGAQVVAIDPSPAARQRATSLGADHVAASADVDAILELTGGGVHVSIDALGSSETAAAGVLTLRRRGRHVQVGLMLDAHSDAPLPWGAVISKELEIVGSHGMAAADYPELLAMVADGRLDPRRLIGRVVTLADAPTELAAMDSLVARTPGLVVATVP